MIFQDITKNTLDVTNATSQVSSANATQSLEGALKALATEMRAPQFSSPLSFSEDLPIRGTPLQGEAGGLFGALRSSGNVHLGLDLAAPIGTAVAAAEDGLVVFAGWARGYGKVVYVNHADGYQTRYAHLSETNVKEGDSVKKGSVVGLVGKTGNADSPDVEPHVHFEVRKILDQNAQDLDSLKAVTNKQSQALDPLPFILGHPAIQATMATPKQVLQKKTSPQTKEYPKEEKKPNQQSKSQEKKKESFIEKMQREILDKLFALMDANKNAVVSAGELKKLFGDNMEQCGGRLTKNDLCKILSQQAGIGLGKSEVATKIIAALDTNGDRILTTDEVDRMVQAIVKQCDVDGDGQLSRAELDGLM